MRTNMNQEINGLKEGYWKYNDSEGHYISDLEEGEWIYYDEHGDVEYIGIYKNGKREGIWLRYHYKNKICSETNYNNDLKNGKYKYYYYDTDTDTVVYEGTYHNNERVGYWVFYEKDGNVEDQEICI